MSLKRSEADQRATFRSAYRERRLQEIGGRRPRAPAGRREVSGRRYWPRYQPCMSSPAHPDATLISVRIGSIVATSVFNAQKGEEGSAHSSKTLSRERRTAGGITRLSLSLRPFCVGRAVRQNRPVSNGQHSGLGPERRKRRLATRRLNRTRGGGIERTEAPVDPPTRGGCIVRSGGPSKSSGSADDQRQRQEFWLYIT